MQEEEYEEVSEDEGEYEDDGDDDVAPVVTPAAAAAASAASAGPAASGATPAVGPKDWVGLQSLPAATQKTLVELLGKLRTKVRERVNESGHTSYTTTEEIFS